MKTPKFFAQLLSVFAGDLRVQGGEYVIAMDARRNSERLGTEPVDATIVLFRVMRADQGHNVLFRHQRISKFPAQFSLGNTQQLDAFRRVSTARSGPAR